MITITTEVDVDFDLSEVYDQLSNPDKAELVDWLYEDGFTKSELTVDGSDGSVVDIIFEETLSKLESKHKLGRLTPEDISIIESIANRF